MPSQPLLIRWQRSRTLQCLMISKKIAQLITSAAPTDVHKYGSIGSKGACLRMREIVAFGDAVVDAAAQFSRQHRLPAWPSRLVILEGNVTGRSASTRRPWYRHVLSPAASRQRSCRLQRRTEPYLRLRTFHQCHRGIRLSKANSTNRRASLSQQRTSTFQLPSPASSSEWT